MEFSTETAVLAACRTLAHRLGLGDTTPRVIGRFSNLAVEMAPTPWVARVATGTAGPRAEPVWARREIALARALHDHCAPVGPPAPGTLAGPHTDDGWRITLWRRLELTEALPEPYAAGRALAACHAALRTLPGDLADDLPEPAPWAALDEAQRLLAHPEVRRRGGEDAAWVADRLAVIGTGLRAHPAPVQWLHGDAHRNNVRVEASGRVVWLDWEDACRAPLEWDLAGLVGAARVLGGADAGWPEAALTGWREVGPAIDEALLAACIEARAMFVVAWTWWLGPDQPGRRERLAARLAWLRARAASACGGFVSNPPIGA